MPATDERAAFLRAIRASPTDDTARLVYADWLEEHGDPGRAAFIREQVAGQKPPRLGAYVSAWEGVLRRAVGRGWGEPRPTVRFARGFVEALVVPIADFVPHAARVLALFADEPLSRIELVGPVPLPAADGSASWWSGGQWIVGLDWSGHRLPARLYRLLPGGSAPYSGILMRRYASPGAAEDALSAACFALARI